jgi:hypothetical protein
MKNKKKELAKINCEEAVARFNDFMDNYLKGRAREELVHHIAECRDCMERFEFEQLLKSKVNELSGSEDKAMRKKIEELIASL